MTQTQNLTAGTTVVVRDVRSHEWANRTGEILERSRRTGLYLIRFTDDVNPWWTHPTYIR